MRSVETEGESIDEAIERALEDLHLSREQVEIEILENGARGLFGIGSRRARVRATARPPLSAGIADLAASPSPGVSRETRGQTASAGDSTARRAREILEAILPHLVSSPRVEVASVGDEAGTVRLSLSGADGGMIIGRRGQTLDALEHLVNRIVLREEAEPRARIALDVEGYRERRQEALEQLARRLAAKARESGRPVTLNPMSPRDRRIVHIALESDPSVSTASEGEGHYRRLVIAPQQGGRHGHASARPR